MPGIFDRLTDSSQYTGAHKARFDAGGQGRGRVGCVAEGEDITLAKIANRERVREGAASRLHPCRASRWHQQRAHHKQPIRQPRDWDG